MASEDSYLLEMVGVSGQFGLEGEGALPSTLPALGLLGY